MHVMTLISLNPYYNGMKVEHNQAHLERKCAGALILILLE